MPGRRDQQPAIATAWLYEMRRVDRVLMGVARRGFDLDPPSVDIGSEPLQRGRSFRTADDHPQVRILACKSPSLADALVGSAKRNHPDELVRLADLPLCASARRAALLAIGGNAPKEGRNQPDGDLLDAPVEVFAHSPSFTDWKAGMWNPSSHDKPQGSADGWAMR